jgi:hypothetical protein
VIDTPPTGGAGLVVYQWMAWRGFLASRLFPAATPLHARFDDTVEAVLAKIPPNATHFLFHINVSVTAGFPARRAELLAALAMRGLRTINDRVTDISKPALQRTFASLALPVVLADRTMSADTPVILKTSLNHGGETERYLPAVELARLGMHLAAPDVGPDYRIMRVADVPGPAWDDKALCIERFISNDAGRYHRAYLWHDRLVLWEGINPAPIKKSFADTSNRLSRFVLVEGRYQPAAGSEPGPQALLEQLAAFLTGTGFSFGTIDAVCDNEGRHYIIDVNTTPYIDVNTPHFRSRAADIIDHLGGDQ